MVTEPVDAPEVADLAVFSGLPQFVMVPLDLYADADVSGDAARLYGVLLSFVGFHEVGTKRSGSHDKAYAPLLGRLPGWSEDKLGRNMTALVKAGWVHRRRRIGQPSLTFVCGWKGQRPTWPGDRSAPRTPTVPPESAGTVPAANPGGKAVEELPKNTSSPSPATPAPGKGPKPRWSDDAREIATEVWDRFTAEGRTPNASNWKGVAQVAQQLLDVGHQRDAITTAILRSSVCTFNAVTLELGTRSLVDGAPAAPANTVPPPARPEVCPACVGHPKWEPLKPGDDESPMVPCHMCRPADRRHWATQGRIPGEDPVAAEPDAPALPSRRDLD